MTDLTDPTAGIGEAWERGVAGPLAEFLTVFARGIAARPDVYSDDLVNSARAVLATVEAPAPSLAEELRGLARRLEKTTDPDRLLDLAADFFSVSDDVAQIEQERDEARDEVDRLTAERDGAREEIAWLRNGPGHTEVATDLPDPADVKPGEAWIVEVNGKRGTALKDGGGLAPWSVVINGVFTSRCDEFITLVTRLVPAPRVITNPDELDALAEGSIVRDNEGDPATRREGGLDYRGVEGVCNDVHHYLPVTVLWEPGA